MKRFLGCCMKFKHYNYNRERFFFLQCDEAADLCQSGLWQCKRFFFFSIFMHLLNHYFEKNKTKVSSLQLLLPLVRECGQFHETNWCPLLVSRMTTNHMPPPDTAGCTSCYVKTAALPYVSLQAIYSKKEKKKRIRPASVFIMTVRTRKHIITLCSCISKPPFSFFFVKNLLQVCGAWMDAAFSR